MLTFQPQIMPDPPCEKFKCQHAQKCKAESLACDAFIFYAQNGRAITPGLKMKNRIPVVVDPEPTRAKYEKVFSGKDEDDG